MFDLLKKVLRPVGPSGMEEPVAAAIREEIEGHVDTIETDAMGNLIATKLGKGEHPRKVMLSAHMDHIGFVVTGVEKEGFLRVTSVGGVDVDESLTRHVVFPSGVEGVVVCEPVTGQKAMKNLFIDIGAQDKEEALKVVQPGDMAVYAPDCFRLGEHRVASPAMDDRCACALLVKLLQTLGDTQDTVMAVFSVQEEVGCRGAKVASPWAGAPPPAGSARRPRSAATNPPLSAGRGHTNASSAFHPLPKKLPCGGGRGPPPCS